MKKLLAVILALTCLFVFASCARDAKNNSLSVNSIIDTFEKKGYSVQIYDDKQISAIEAKLILEGEITSIAHIVNQDPAASQMEFVYVYELSSEKDAAEMEENRQAYVQTIENGKCVRAGKVVVFGNSPLIDELIK